MNDPLQDYIKVGLVHFMAWPGCMPGETSESTIDASKETLLETCQQI